MVAFQSCGSPPPLFQKVAVQEEGAVPILVRPREGRRRFSAADDSPLLPQRAYIALPSPTLSSLSSLVRLSSSSILPQQKAGVQSPPLPGGSVYRPPRKDYRSQEHDRARHWESFYWQARSRLLR